MKRSLVLAELEQVRASGGGMLRPESVVEFARDESTELHKCFEWDDTEAAIKFRLEQARQIIRVAVIVHPRTNEKINAFVSLRSDRERGGGYRATVDVLNEEALLAELMEDCRCELAEFTAKYQRLQRVAEFAPVLEAAGKIATAKKKRKGVAA